MSTADDENTGANDGDADPTQRRDLFAQQKQNSATTP